MHLSKITIQNFRGIKKQELFFTKFNTLIGKNDCGKSTVINAIKLFFGNEKSLQKDFNFYEKENKNIVIEIEISEYPEEYMKNFLLKGEKEDGFEDVVQDYIFNGKIIIKKEWGFKDSGEITSKNIEIRVNSFQNYDIYSAKSSDINKWMKELKVDIPQQGAGNNSDLEKKSYIRKKLLENKKERQKMWISVPHKDFQNALPSIELLKADQSIETTTTEFKGTFSTEIRSIIKTEKESGDKSTLADIENKISEKIQEESKEIQKCMSAHISDLEELSITPDFSWEKGVEITNVKIRLFGDEEFIPLENKGSGYRRLFMVGRLRYLAEKKESENVIYLVEEPETFLHPSAQDEMLHSLLSLSESNQIFITTHSPIFTGATKKNAITLCKKEKTALTYEQKDDDDFLEEIAKQLGVKPSHNILDTYETIVFVEGSNDRKFLQIASEKLGKDLHSQVDSGKIAIIEGGGGSLNNFIDIQYFEKQEKQMFLIIDSDEYDSNQITNPDTQKSLDRKKQENIDLKNKFEEKRNAKCFILKKKNIDTYYHPEAIRRINNTFPKMGIFADNFCFETYLKENRYNKNKNPQGEIKGNVKKNWLEVFREMTSEEWEEVSSGELEAIFDEIVSAKN